jgi:hypothetical protein
MVGGDHVAAGEEGARHDAERHPACPVTMGA